MSPAFEEPPPPAEPAKTPAEPAKTPVEPAKTPAEPKKAATRTVNLEQEHVCSVCRMVKSRKQK